jgi:hypothetical protein
MVAPLDLICYNEQNKSQSSENSAFGYDTLVGGDGFE